MNNSSNSFTDFVLGLVTQSQIAIGRYLSIGFTLGIGIWYGVNVSDSSVCNATHDFNRAEYERLDLQMSLVEAEVILGKGIEIDQSEESAIFIWENCDGSYVKASFKKNRLVRKIQSGLR